MKKTLIAGVVLVVVLGGGFLFLNASTNGIAGFYLWSALGGRVQAANVAVNGTTIHVETFGDAESARRPVLVLHGGTAFLETMHAQITLLADDRLVIAPDSRAHGRSGDADGVALTYDLMAEDMIALLDHLAIEEVDIVGWSDGGNIGLIMAMTAPERVGRLVMYGSNAHYSAVDSALIDRDPDSETWASVKSFYDSVAPEPAHWPVALGKIIDMWATQPALEMAQLADVGSPVLVMAGEFDSIDEAHTRAMAAALPNAELFIVPGQDHFAPLMAPETVNPHIEVFLN